MEIMMLSALYNSSCVFVLNRKNFLQIDKSSDVDLQVVDSLTEAEENDELMIPAELKSVKEFDCHVSDALEPLQGNVVSFYFVIFMLH